MEEVHTEGANEKEMRKLGKVAQMFTESESALVENMFLSTLHVRQITLMESSNRKRSRQY